MDLRIPERDLAWKSEARDFAEPNLFPHEVEFELSGHLSADTHARLREALVEHDLNAINHAKERGGQGLTRRQQILVKEEVAKATKAEGKQGKNGRSDREHAGDDIGVEPITLCFVSVIHFATGTGEQSRSVCPLLMQ